jgi:ferric-dicitrate binding protein FerR (iron transport regulator)
MLNLEQKNLIEKLFQRSCTEEELEQIFRFVKELPEDLASRVMMALWEESRDYPALKTAFSGQLYQKILGRIQEQNGDAFVQPTPIFTLRAGRRRLLGIWSVAAALLLMVALATWLWTNREQQLVVRTEFAEQQTFRLPDGSEVILNANSILKFDQRWNTQDTRKVWLTGEAFFRVKPQPGRGQKFQVITPDLVVEVLGTVFNVYSREEQTSVYLEEGKVALRLKHLPESEKLMEPGDLISYSAKRKIVLTDTKAISPKLQTSWKDGVLIFEDTPLTEVLEKLEAIYGIEFQVVDTVNYRRQITTGLPMEELEIVLPILQNALNLNITEKDGKYILRE